MPFYSWQGELTIKGKNKPSQGVEAWRVVVCLINTQIEFKTDYQNQFRPDLILQRYNKYHNSIIYISFFYTFVISNIQLRKDARL